jgi:phage replication-related protein YjqB (UPF0714/DUF867 family)
MSGFKGHISVEPDTQVVLSTSFAKDNELDTNAALALHGQEDQPVVVYGDTRYLCASFRDKLDQGGHQAVIKCHPLFMAVLGALASKTSK